MSTSRKDYEAMASALSRQIKEAETNGDTKLLSALVTLAIDSATYFGDDNPRFDRRRYLKACGVSDSEGA